MNTFADRENKVFNFMERVQNEQLMKEEEDAFQNSTDYKLKVLDKTENDAKAYCLDNIFCRIYKDAVPLNDDYKSAHCDDLDASFRDFLATKCPKGIEWYVREGIKKGSPFAKKVLEAVEDLVNNEYKPKALDIENIDTKDLVFKSGEDIQPKLDVVAHDLSIPEISAAVQTNVRDTALSEITRAKKEKEALKNLESELANDVNVTTQEAVQNALELRDMGEPKDFTPSLFQGIMINKLNKIQPRFESGELDNEIIYDTLSIFGKESQVNKSGDIQPATAEELAFVEAVKEYTGHSILKALRLESYYPKNVRELADLYAQDLI